MPSKRADIGAFAAMHGVDANIDRHGRVRTVPLEVMSLGFSRTGTLSMQEAFAILGYPAPYHFGSILSNIQDVDIWNPLLERKLRGGPPILRRELDQVIGHCGALTDAPCTVLWQEMLAAYPGAEVVLVERDEDKWYASMDRLLTGILNPVAKYVLRYTDPNWGGKIFVCGFLWVEAWVGTTNLSQAKRDARAAYRAHNAGIKAAVPREKLLEYRLGSGWEPICRFLGKPVPDVPFPHNNESTMLKAAFEQLVMKSLKRSAVNVSIAVAAMALVIGVGMRLLG